MQGGIHSTGRGGAGNIGEDGRTYADGDIVREGVAGEHSRPEYSSGRGGAGNMIESPRGGTPAPVSEDIVPETATRPADSQENFHTGRGGQGNVHREKFGGHSSEHEQRDEGKEGIADRIKHVMGLDRHKPEEGSGLKQETKS